MFDDQDFEWNWGDKTSEFWDSSRNLPTRLTSSLKYQLANPNGIKTDDAIRNIGQGIAMIMDKIEEFERKNK